MPSFAVASEPTPTATGCSEQTGAAASDAYAARREDRHFRQPRSRPSFAGRPPHRETQFTSATGELADDQLDDLIFSWQRLTDPKLKKLVIQIVRSMAA